MLRAWKASLFSTNVICGEDLFLVDKNVICIEDLCSPKMSCVENVSLDDENIISVEELFLVEENLLCGEDFSLVNKMLYV